MFGKFDLKSGAILEDTNICVLTGKPIEPGDMMLKLKGTPYFVRVSASAVNLVTPGFLETLRSELPTEDTVPTISTEAVRRSNRKAADDIPEISES
jgi:hypothetical protein